MRQSFEPGHNLETDPDPADLHVFARGQAMTLGYDKQGNIFIRLRVTALANKFVLCDFWVKGLTPTPIKRSLDLGCPVVVLRLPDGQPSLTLTLRKIEGDRAFIQVTAHPSISQHPRTAA